mgnify:FL=1
MIPLESYIKKHTKTPVLFSPELKKVIVQYCGEVFDEGKLAAMASYQNHLGFNKEQIEEKKQSTLKTI